MLEKLDLTKKLSKEEYSAQMDALGGRLGRAQRLAREAKRPVIIVFEGWRGARRSALINEMMQQMDARGFNVYSTVRLGGSLQEQPFFTFFWQHLPALGHMAVYHRSWYYLKHANELQHKDEQCKKCLAISYEHINNFEKMLTDDNYLILKFFLHLSPEQQKKNIAKNAKTLGKAWRDLNPAIDESDDYDKYLNRYEKMLEASDTANAPWHLVAADDGRSARIEVFTKIAEAIEAAVAAKAEVSAPQRTAAAYDVLSKVNPDKELSKEEFADVEEYSTGFNFCGINLLGNPTGSNFKEMLWVVPLLCFISSATGIFISQKINGMGNEAQGCMKFMPYGTVLFTTYVTYTMPAAVGFYWFVNGVIGSIISIIIGKYWNIHTINAKSEAARISMLEAKEAKVISVKEEKINV